jgi:sulfur carrier protein ThiS
MRITVKVTGLLGRYLPPGATGNVAELEVAAEATPLDVMRRLGLPLEGAYLLVLNGTAVPKREHATCRLQEHDTLAIMPPLRGG